MIFGRHYLILFKFNYELMSQKIIDYVNNLDEETWDKLAQKIGRIGKWEFEDYRGL